MAYCSTQQVRELVDGAPDLKLPGETDLANYISQAQSWAEGQLRGMGYEVPYVDGSVPPYVQLLVATRAAYLLVRRHNTSEQFESLMDELRKDYQDMLNDLREGNVALDLPDDADEEALRVSYGQVNPHGRPVFTYGKDGRRIK